MGEDTTIQVGIESTGIEQTTKQIAELTASVRSLSEALERTAGVAASVGARLAAAGKVSSAASAAASSLARETQDVDSRGMYNRATPEPPRRQIPPPLYAAAPPGGTPNAANVGRSSLARETHDAVAKASSPTNARTSSLAQETQDTIDKDAQAAAFQHTTPDKVSSPVNAGTSSLVRETQDVVDKPANTASPAKATALLDLPPRRDPNLVNARTSSLAQETQDTIDKDAQAAAFQHTTPDKASSPANAGTSSLVREVHDTTSKDSSLVNAGTSSLAREAYDTASKDSSPANTGTSSSVQETRDVIDKTAKAAAFRHTTPGKGPSLANAGTSSLVREVYDGTNPQPAEEQIWDRHPAFARRGPPPVRDEQTWAAFHEELRFLTTRLKGFREKFVEKAMTVYSAGVDGVNVYSRYRQGIARTVGRFNPFNIWSYPQTVLGLGKAQAGLLEGVGGKAMTIGSTLLQTGSPLGMAAGAPLALAGGGMSIAGMFKKMNIAQWEGALGLVKNVTHSVIGGVMDGLKKLRDVGAWVAEGLLSTTRKIIGGFTHLLGAGVGLAAAGGGIVQSTLSQSVFYNNEAFTGISLWERQKHEHLENLFFLPQGTLQSEVVNFNRMLAEFNTLGQFDNGIEKALLGQINATVSGKGGTEGYLALVDSLTALRRENVTGYQAIEALAHRVGWDAAIHMAGQQVEGKSRDRVYYKYANSENAERTFRANKPVFDDVKTAVGYIMKDIANTLWGKEIPFLGATGREIGVQVANVLGQVPRALAGDTRGLWAGVKNLAGLGVRGVNNAGTALDKALGVPVWGITRGALAKGADLLDVTLGALQSGEWTPVWTYIGDRVKELADTGASLFKNVVEQGKPALASLWSWVAAKVTAFFSSDFPNTLMTGLHNVATWLHTTLEGALSKIDTSAVKSTVATLAYEFLYAFEPAIKWIGKSLLHVMSEVVQMIKYIKTPHLPVKNPYTEKEEAFVFTRGRADELRAIEAVKQEARSRATAGWTDIGQELARLPQREVYQFIERATGDQETAEYASRIKGFIDKYEGDPKYLRDMQGIYGRSVGAFNTLDNSRQQEILRGEDTDLGLGRVAAWEIYGEGKDAISRTVDRLLETLKEAGDFSFGVRRSAGEELRAEAAAGVTGQAGAATWAATVTDLRKTVADLREALTALAAKQDVPLTGVVTLTDPNGNHQQVTLTQEQLARLSSGYTFPARFR